jgi:sugar-phosphatase
MPTFHCSAILFDLDGVLVDSTRSVGRQWRAWAAEHNIAPEKAVEIAHGVRTIEVVRLLAPHLDGDAEVKNIEQREAEDTDGVAAMPGASKLIESLPDRLWGVVTSGTRYLATSRLRLANLPIPKVLVSAEDVKKGKPDPEPYLTGARLLGFKPADCLVIEDAPAGIRSAHDGGMKVIALTSTYPSSDLMQADAIVDRLGRIGVAAQDGKLRIDV